MVIVKLTYDSLNMGDNISFYALYNMDTKIKIIA